MAETITWGGVNNSSLGLLLETFEDSGIETTYNEITIPQRPGSIIVNRAGDLGIFGIRTLTCTFSYYERDYETGEVEVQRQIKSAFNPFKGIQQLIRSISPTKMYRCRVEGSPQISRPSSLSRIWTVIVQFICSDPFIYDGDNSFYNSSIANGQTVVNAGDVPGDATVELTATGSAVSIWWEESNKLNMSGLVAGDIITVAGPANQILVNGTPYTQNRDFIFNPDQNYMQVPLGTATFHSSGASNINLKFRQRWL